MSFATFARQRRLLRYLPSRQQLAVNDFSGGLNLRDAPTELASNETPDALNITLDQRGGVIKRLGLKRLNAVALAGPAQTLYYWGTGGVMIVQVGATVYSTSDFVTFTSLKVFTTNARAAFTDFQYQLVAVHPVDGVWTSTGGAFTQTTGGLNNMEAVKGTCLAAWQNKCFVAGDPVNKSRVWWCNLGDPRKWTVASDWVDIREKDDLPVTALGVGQGMDILGRPGMLVFKEESTYRINNVVNGSFTTLDGHIGAAGPQAVATLNGVTAAVSRHGIYVTDGVRDLQNVSEKVQPLFTPVKLNFAQIGLMTAGIYRDRIVFSMPSAGSAVNNLTLEFHPPSGWIVAHSFGAASFGQWGKQDEKLYSSNPTTGYLYETFAGGSDDGVAVTARYQTPWFTPSQASNNCQFLKLMLSGRGLFDLNVKLNFTAAGGSTRKVTMVSTPWVWGDGTLWGQTVWGPNNFENYQAFDSLGMGRSISFQFTHTGTDSVSGQAILGQGTPEVGAFAVYNLALDYVRLGIS